MATTSKFSQPVVSKLFVLFLLCFALLLVSGCGSSLVGKWEIEMGQPTYGIPENLELLKDGTGIIDQMGVTWKTESGRLYATSPLIAGAWNYKISGTTLTLTMDDGRNIMYKKQR